MKTSTIEDIARLAGVGRGTVSRVLNNQPGVSDEKRRRVQEVVSRLDYQVNPIAKSLKTNRQRNIGCVIDTFRGYTRPRVVEGAVRKAEQLGYNLIISEASLSESGEPKTFSKTMNQYVEGMLILYAGSTDDAHELASQLPKSLPIVTTGYALGGPRAVPCKVDNVQGAYRGVQALIDLGHTEIMMITGPERHYDVVDRTKGYYDAYRGNNLKLDLSLIVNGDWSVRSGYDRVQEALASAAQFTAIFAQNDWMAIGALKCLTEHEISVPGDVSIIGFNDSPFSRYMTPTLSTVRYPARELGEYCVTYLINEISQKREEEQNLEIDPSVLVPELILRDSTGPKSATD